MQQSRAKAGGGHESFDDLPENVQQRVLSFMPAREAVQTCVLTRSWHHRWKSMPALRIHIRQVWSESEGQNMRRFVDNLLSLRDRSAGLKLCEFIVRDTNRMSGPQFSSWIQKVLMCKPQILRLDHREKLGPEMCFVPLISRGLSTLELKSVDLRDKLLDFSRCSTLKNLLMRCCLIGWSERISSQSLEHLNIMYRTFPSHTQTHISAPSLISLQLSENYGNTPFLESMPLLVSAFLRLHGCEDTCHREEYEIVCSDNGCSKCGAYVVGSKDCVLLEGLSKAKSLELVAQPGVFLFGMDLMCCPTFSNLKTLLLNEWCVVSGLHLLICCLQHTPVLEKLTLQLGQMPVDWVETEGSYNPVEQPFPSKKLTIAEIFYEQFDKRVHAVSRILKAYDIQHIQHTERPSKVVQVLRCVRPQSTTEGSIYCRLCGISNSPAMLLHHFADKSGPHSWPVEKISYDTTYPFVAPEGKEHRRLLVAEEDGAAFLLAVNPLAQNAVNPLFHFATATIVSISGDGGEHQWYRFVLSALAPDPVDEGNFRPALFANMGVVSCAAPDEVLVEDLFVEKKLLHRGPGRSGCDSA